MITPFEKINAVCRTAVVRIEGTAVPLALNRCTELGLEIISTAAADDYTIDVRVPCRQAKKIEDIARRCQCTAIMLEESGSVRAVKRLRRRAPAAALMTAVLALLIWSRAYVWDIEISGNAAADRGDILSALEQCGVEPGACWLGWNQDLIRSRMLVLMPELSWMTVNIRGSRAEVIVRERVEKPEMVRQDAPAALVAGRSGVVTRVTALEGQATVRKGQAVLKGETLVSGKMTDIRGDARYTHALGEVWALTFYEETAVCPSETRKKTPTGRASSRWALEIGSVRIKFYGNSSNYGEDCDKIYSEYRLGIKGLFELPVKLTREKRVYYETQTQPRDARTAADAMRAELYAALPDERDADILATDYTLSEKGGLLYVCLRAECEENIALSVPGVKEETAQ